MSEQLIATPGTFGENGNFLLERELGAGGMGGVYMGRDKMLDRPVAVKVMLKELGSDAEFVEKFKKEAQSAARLIHPNIAQVYSYGICDGMPYIAMELASGGSLYSIMNANPGKTDIPRIIKICQQVAQALQCASDQGCVHGDVKPENVLLDANGNAKLVDFGLAAMQKDTSEIWGTPYYISPEKVRKEQIDFRADMYSLGGTLYHALTGVAPFEGEDAVAVVRKRFDGMPKKPSEIRPEITPAIDELVMKMLALNKEDRYPSFEALLEAFKSVLTNGLTPGATLSRPTTGTRRMTTTMRTRRAMAMKRGGTTAAEEKPEGEASEDAEKTEEKEEGSSHLGLKVAGVVVGAILLVGGIVGGLFWYKVSSENAQKAEEQAQIVGGIEKAKQSVADTVAKAMKFADETDANAEKAIAECEKTTKELKGMLPKEIGDMLKPGPSKELLEAIAATNGTPVAAAAPATNAAPAAAATPAPAPAATNAAPAKAEAKADGKAAAKEKKADAKDKKGDAKAKKGDAKGKKDAKGKRDEKPKAEAAAPAKEEKPAEPPPQIVLTMNELWNRAYGCQASAIRVRQAARDIAKKAAEANGLTDQTRATMDKMAELSHVVVDMLDQLKGSKDIENINKGVTFIASKCDKTVEQTAKQIRRDKLEAERKAKIEAAAAAEKAHLEKIEAEKKAKIEEETAAAKSKFDAIAEQGCFRQLDWKSAIRQLEAEKSEYTTPEGALAIDAEIRKVNNMKKVQDIFVKRLNGHVFKGKLKGAKVTSVNDKDISLVKEDGKSKMKISWQKFYKSYPGNLNEIMNAYIVNARKPTAKYKLNLRDWADAMTGSALTMQLVCSEVNGAVARAETLAKETVKQFPEYLETAKEMFPEITFEAAEE